MRHILRQDPDIIMVGEIRDQETAEIAIRASLTGHLVLSTLHTNDAAGAINRLVDMDIEPFLIASSIEMVIAPRLIRSKSCCINAGLTEKYISTCIQSMRIQDTCSPDRIMTQKGCEKCRTIGYREIDNIRISWKDDLATTQSFVKVTLGKYKQKLLEKILR